MDRVIGTVTKSADSVAEAPAGVVTQGSAAGRSPGPQADAVASGRVTGPPPGLLERAREAPPRHGLSRVWPAVALGPFAELLPTLQAKLGDATALSAADVSRAISAFAQHPGAAAAPPPERSGTPSSAPAEHRVAPLPLGGEISILVLLLASATLTALLVFAVRQELGPTYRWPQ